MWTIKYRESFFRLYIEEVLRNLRRAVGDRTHSQGLIVVTDVLAESVSRG